MTTTPAPARPKPPTAAGMLRLVEAIPETPENFPILRELQKSLEILVKIADEVTA